MSLAMPVREKGKGKTMPPWWQDHLDQWVVAGQPPQIPAEYLRNPETEEHDPQAIPPWWWTAEARSEGSEGSESVGVDSQDLPTMFERYGVDTDELPTHREMGLDLDSDSPDIDGEDPWHPEVLRYHTRHRGWH